MTAVDELITWLRAQLDEDERVARAASVGPWLTKRADSVYADETTVVLQPGPLPDWATLVVPPQEEGGEGIDPGNAEHIARWDPARVLAEIDAKRRILEIHHHIECQHDRYGPDGDCAECGNEYPCETVHLLAQPYAGHDGWREEWQLSDGA